MASVVNALRNIISDKMWLIKLAIFTAPVYYILEDEKIFNSLLANNLRIAIFQAFVFRNRFRNSEKLFNINKCTVYFTKFTEIIFKRYRFFF